MSDDEIEREGQQDPTRVMGTGKELLCWLRPGSSTGPTGEQSTGEGSAGGTSLDRRSYMLLAGGAAAAAVGGTAASNAVSASETTISQPDLYGYGGADLHPSGQETTLLSTDEITDTVTQTEENAERATAMEISPGTLVNASLETATVDWFVFEAAAGDPITVEYDRENELGITGLILYGPDGSFQDKLYVGSGSTHTLSHVAEESGDHYLQVIDVTDGAGEYAFVVWLQEEVPDGDDDDERSEDSDDEDDGSDDSDEDGDDSDDSDEDADDSDDETYEERHLELSAVDETAEYTITVDGDAEPGDNANTHEHEYQDSVTEDGDQAIIHGFVSSAGLDDYYVTGEFVDAESTEPLDITVDGEDRSIEDLVEGDTDDDADDSTDDGSDDSTDDSTESTDDFGKLGYGEGPYGGTDE